MNRAKIATRATLAAAAATWIAVAPAASSTLYDTNHCDERLVLCFQPNGDLFETERKEELRVGEQLHIIVIGAATGKEISIDVHASTVQNRMVPAPVVPVAIPLGPPSPLEKLVERVVDVPNADSLTIYIVQKSGDTSSTGSTTLAIQDTLYFARAGLAFAWVTQGARTITAEHTIVQETEFFPGVALTIWPWGHRNRTLSGLERLSKTRTFGDTFALQVGTDLDFTKPFDRAFLGVTLEPIAGMGVSAGLAITRGQFFSGSPAGTDMAVVDKYMLHPYGALTLTTELFDTLRSLAGQKK